MNKNFFEEPTLEIVAFRREDVVSCESNLSGSETTPGGNQTVLGDDD